MRKVSKFAVVVNVDMSQSLSRSSQVAVQDRTPHFNERPDGDFEKQKKAAQHLEP